MKTQTNSASLAGLALRCQPDSRLVVLVREGRERAFEEIVRRYRALLVSFAGAIVPDHRAEDVVQDSLIRAHDALLAGDAEINLKPWLYTIVRNRALNDLRDQPAHEHLDESFDGVPQPPEVAARRAEFATLTSRIKALPSLQREALVRRELEGRSHEEIARGLGVTPGAVRGLIFRARTTLRDVAGILVPMPLVRALADGGSLRTGAAGSGIGEATVGLTAGGGAAIAVKAGTTLVVAVLALGSGVALRHRGGKEPVTIASASHHGGSSAQLTGFDPQGARGGAIESSHPRSGVGTQGSEGSDDQDRSSSEGSDSSVSGGDGRSGEGTSGGGVSGRDNGPTTSATSGDGDASGTSGAGSGTSGDGGTITSDDGASGGDGGAITSGTSGDGGESGASGDGTSGSDDSDGGVITSDGGDSLEHLGSDDGSSGN